MVETVIQKKKTIEDFGIGNRMVPKEFTQDLSSRRTEFENWIDSAVNRVVDEYEPYDYFEEWIDEYLEASS